MTLINYSILMVNKNHSIQIANEFGMIAKDNAFMKYNKLTAAIYPKWLDNPPSLSNFDSFIQNVIQSIINLTIVQTSILFIDKK